MQQLPLRRLRSSGLNPIPFLLSLPRALHFLYRRCIRQVATQKRLLYGAPPAYFRIINPFICSIVLATYPICMPIDISICALNRRRKGLTHLSTSDSSATLSNALFRVVHWTSFCEVLFINSSSLDTFPDFCIYNSERDQQCRKMS